MVSASLYLFYASRVQRHIHGLLRSCSVRPSPEAKQGWVPKQGLNHAKSRNRDAWKRWVPKQGLNYVKPRIGEAAAQAQAESRPRPNTCSRTAAFVLRASFAVSKAGVGA